MATVNFSVPDDVKAAFNNAFETENKSAIIAALMMEAVERAARKQLSSEAITRILARREHSPSVSEEDIRQAREQGRP